MWCLPPATGVRVDAELIEDLKVVSAPVLEVYQRVVQRCAIVAGKGIDVAKDLGGFENVRRDDVTEQAKKLIVSELDAVQSLELLSEVKTQQGMAGDIGAIAILSI